MDGVSVCGGVGVGGGVVGGVVCLKGQAIVVFRRSDNHFNRV